MPNRSSFWLFPIETIVTMADCLPPLPLVAAPFTVVGARFTRGLDKLGEESTRVDPEE